VELISNPSYYEIEQLADFKSVIALSPGVKCSLVSISPTFYEQLLRQNPFAKKLQTQIVST
jgi:hypothetical protein